MKFLKQCIKGITPWLNIDKKVYHIYCKGHKWSQRNNNYIASFFENKIYSKYHCIISAQANIGTHLQLPHPLGIVIGAGVKIGDNVTIYQNVTLGRKYKHISDYPQIGDNVIIYANSVVIGGVKIGDGAIIGCNSVVLRDVHANEIVSGIVK